MNTLMLVALAVVLLCYCGGKYCPKVLSSNKEMLLGVLVGIALCSFAGLKLEGFMVPDCAKMLDDRGEHVARLPREGERGSTFVPPSCRGYRRGQESGTDGADEEGDDTWCRTSGAGAQYCTGLVPDCAKILEVQDEGNIVKAGFAPPSCVGYPNSQVENDPMGDDTWCENQIDPSVYCSNPYIEMRQKNQLRRGNLSNSGLSTTEGAESLLRQLRNNNP